MFSKKTEKIMFLCLVIYYVLFLLSFFVSTIICAQNNIKTSDYNIYFQLGILIPLTLVLIYVFIVKPIYLANNISIVKNLITTREYDELNRKCSGLANKNPNRVTKTLFCISLIYKKEYNNFNNYYSKNKSILTEVYVYSVLLKFMLGQMIDESDFIKAQQNAKLYFTAGDISLLLKKIECLQLKQYKECLNIAQDTCISNNELLLYIFNKCELLAKQNLDLEYSSDIENINKSYFN